jgi:carbon storage regulator CsrA
MLVVSREKDESVMVGDDLCVKVLKVRDERALIAVSRRQAGVRITLWDESKPRWMGAGENIELGDGMWSGLVDVRAEKVRLGFEVPHGVRVHRQEVYDAINRLSRRDLE